MKEKITLPDGYSAAVLHAHTDRSDGMVSPWQLVEAASRNNIKVLAITDHDTMAGIEEARLAGKDFKVEIIAGEEITTALPRALHVIGLFLKDEIPHSKSFGWTLKEIKRQNGLIIIPHPLSRLFALLRVPTASFQKRDLLQLVTNVKVDGIETRHNGLNAQDARWLDQLYEQHKEKLGAKLGVPDSHFGSKDLCSYITLFPGQTKEDLYQAIKSGKTVPKQGLKPQISSRDLLKQNFQALFLVGSNRYKQLVLRVLKNLFESH